MSDDDKTISLSAYDPSGYTQRGNIHDLEYYDGPLISAQMCRAKEDVPVIEVAIDNRAAETDGFTVYTRFSKEDLQTMLRMLEDPVVEQPQRCPAYSGTGGRCLTCDPTPVATEEPGFWVVVDEENKPRRLSAHATQASAETWIGHQPDKAKVERGGYGIEGPCYSLDLVPMPDGLDEVTQPHVPDLAFASPAGGGIFDFSCKKCRVLGSIKVEASDINWDDDGKGCS